MEIRGSCVYDLAVLRDMRKNHPVRLWLFRVLLAIGIVLTVWSAAMLVRGYTGKLLPYIFLYGLFLCSWPILNLPWVQYKLMGKRKNLAQDYQFCTEGFHADHRTSDMHGMTEARYSSLEKVIESPRYLYLYIDKRGAQVVDKSTLTGGTMEELRAVLQGVHGKKYKIRKR